MNKALDFAGDLLGFSVDVVKEAVSFPGKIIEDIKNFDSKNADEQVAIDSNYFS